MRPGEEGQSWNQRVRIRAKDQSWARGGAGGPVLSRRSRAFAGGLGEEETGPDPQKGVKRGGEAALAHRPLSSRVFSAGHLTYGCPSPCTPHSLPVVLRHGGALL